MEMLELPNDHLWAICKLSTMKIVTSFIWSILVPSVLGQYDYNLYLVDIEMARVNYLAHCKIIFDEKLKNRNKID